MRLITYLPLLAFLACCSCRKTAAFWASPGASLLFPPPSQLSLSYAATGSLVFSSNIEAVYSNDTLTICSNNGYNAIRIWLVAASLKDTSYFLDQRSGGIQVYDQRGNIVAFSVGPFSISVYPHTNNVIAGSLNGVLYNYQGLPITTTGSFSNVSVYVTPGG